MPTDFVVGMFRVSGYSCCISTAKELNRFSLGSLAHMSIVLLLCAFSFFEGKN